MSCERKSLEKLATQRNHARRYTNMAKKVLLVSTSAGQMGEHPTGLWISELAEPYTVFTKAGFDVTIASIAGGAVPIDAGSLAEPFLGRQALQRLERAGPRGQRRQVFEGRSLDVARRRLRQPSDRAEPAVGRGLRGGGRQGARVSASRRPPRLTTKSMRNRGRWERCSHHSARHP